MEFPKFDKFKEEQPNETMTRLADLPKKTVFYIKSMYPTTTQYGPTFKLELASESGVKYVIFTPQSLVRKLEKYNVETQEVFLTYHGKKVDQERGKFYHDIRLLKRD